jgi:hypothetical protein
MSSPRLIEKKCTECGVKFFALAGKGKYCAKCKGIVEKRKQFLRKNKDGKYLAWVEENMLYATQENVVYEDTPRDPPNAIVSVRDSIDWDKIERENQYYERKRKAERSVNYEQQVHI